MLGAHPLAFQKKVLGFQCQEVSTEAYPDIPPWTRGGHESSYLQDRFTGISQVAKTEPIIITKICSPSAPSLSLKRKHQLSSHWSQKYGGIHWLTLLFSTPAQVLNRPVLPAMPTKPSLDYSTSPPILNIAPLQLPNRPPCLESHSSTHSILHTAAKGIFLKCKTDHVPHLPTPLKQSAHSVIHHRGTGHGSGSGNIRKNRKQAWSFPSWGGHLLSRDR